MNKTMQGPMKRILIVDNEPEIARLIQRYLISKNYEVHTAADGREALQRVEEVKPHIILLDIIMPGMGGIDFLKTIKRTGANIVVIVVTAVIDKAMRQKALRAGADDYINKPFLLGDLETTIRKKLAHIDKEEFTHESKRKQNV